MVTGKLNRRLLAIFAALPLMAQYPSFSSAPAASSGGGSGASVTVWSASTVTLTAGTYFTPTGGGAAVSATESSVQVPIAVGAKIQDLFVQLSVALGAGTNAVITWRDLGSDSILTCTISDPATQCSDTSHSLTVGQGNAESVKIVTTGTVTATPDISISAVFTNMVVLPTGTPVLISHVAILGTGTTSAIDTTGADFCVANVVNFGATPAPTDSGGGTWTGLAQQPNVNVQMYYSTDTVQGPGHTFSIVAATGAMEVACFGNIASVPLDQNAGSSSIGSFTTYQIGSITPTANKTLVISGFGANNSGGTITSVDSGFTITDTNQPTGGTIGGSLAYLVQGPLAAENPTWTTTGNTAVGGTNANFKPHP